MFDEARALITKVVLDQKRAGTSLVFDNDPFQWGNVPAVFDHVQISFHGGDQIGMAAAPKTRTLGHLYLDTHVAQGAGTKAAAESMDWLKAALEYRQLAGSNFRVTFESFQPAGDSPRAGRTIYRSKILFRIHPT